MPQENRISPYLVNSAEIELGARLPDIFWGKWSDNLSFHDCCYLLTVNCSCDEKGARLMTAIQAQKEAPHYTAKAFEMQELSYRYC